MDATRRALVELTDEAAPGGVDEILPLQERLDQRLYAYKFLSALAGFLGGLALLLTVSGVYGVLSHLVNQRKREFGIRVALGADGGDVAWMVFRQSLRLAMLGAVLGALATAAVARVAAHFVQPMNVFDPAGYAAGAVVVIAAALGASWVPARRAIRVDPAVTLRCD